MKSERLKENFFQESAQIFKLLSSPIRLKLINYISFCPRSVENCAQKLNQSVQNTSLHLIALAKAGILQVEKNKNFRIYSLKEKNVLDLIFSRLTSGSKPLLKENLLWQEGVESLAQAAKSKKISLIDLREKEESLYLPVANSILFHESSSKFKAFLREFDSKHCLVFFCRGHLCENMVSAVQVANRHNYLAKGAELTALELERLNEKIKGA